MFRISLFVQIFILFYGFHLNSKEFIHGHLLPPGIHYAQTIAATTDGITTTPETTNTHKIPHTSEDNSTPSGLSFAATKKYNLEEPPKVTIPPFFAPTFNLNLSRVESPNPSDVQEFMHLLNVTKLKLDNQTYIYHEDLSQNVTVVAVYPNRDFSDGATWYALLHFYNNTYTFTPISPNNNNTADLSETWRVVIGTKLYLLRQIFKEDKAQKVEFREEVLDLETQDYLVTKDVMSKRMDLPGREPVDKNMMVIEVFVVVDFSCYKKWLEFSKKNKRKAMYNINSYISYLIQGISEKFSSIKLSSYKYSVKLIGYHVIKTAEDSSFSETPLVETSTLTQRSLEEFTVWLEERKSKFPKYDVALALTNHDLEHFKGLSFIRTTCTKMGVSLVSDRGLEDTVDTAVHEIGHL